MLLGCSPKCWQLKLFVTIILLCNFLGFAVKLPKLLLDANIEEETLKELLRILVDFLKYQLQLVLLNLLIIIFFFTIAEVLITSLVPISTSFSLSDISCHEGSYIRTRVHSFSLPTMYQKILKSVPTNKRTEQGHIYKNLYIIL